MILGTYAENVRLVSGERMVKGQGVEMGAFAFWQDDGGKCGSSVLTPPPPLFLWSLPRHPLPIAEDRNSIGWIVQRACLVSPAWSVS